MRTFEVGHLDEYLRQVPKAARTSLGCILAYAVTRASIAVPRIRQRYQEEGAKAFVTIDEATHLGLAVDAPGPHGTRLVVVPVIPDASQLNFDGFSRYYQDLTVRARAGRLRVEELQHANLIVTNTAAFGSTMGVPRLPTGVGAIVALGTIGYPPGLSRVAASLDIGRIMTASCTYDHRVIQGGDSGQFLDALAHTIAGSSFYDGLASGRDVAHQHGEDR